MVSIKKIIGSFTAVSLCGFLFIGQAIADSKDSSSKNVTQSNQLDVIRFTQARLERLKTKLNLQPAQLGAWDQWSAHLIADVKKQQEDDIKLTQNWMDKEADNLTTPEKIAHQEKHLQMHIAHLQNQLTRLEDARVNATTFYSNLSKDQQTIFDLYWHESAFNHAHIGQ